MPPRPTMRMMRNEPMVVPTCGSASAGGSGSPPTLGAGDASADAGIDGTCEPIIAGGICGPVAIAEPITAVPDGGWRMMVGHGASAAWSWPQMWQGLGKGIGRTVYSAVARGTGGLSHA